MVQKQKKTITILLPVELYEELSMLAESDSRSLSSYIRQVLRAHLEYIARFKRP